MKTIVEIEWDDKNERKFSIGLLSNALSHFNIGSVFAVRELPAQPEQGQGGRSCENCNRLITNNAELCYTCNILSNWQSIPGNIESCGKPSAACCGCACLNTKDCPKNQPIPGKVEEKSNETTAMAYEHQNYILQDIKRRDEIACHAQGEGERCLKN